MKFSEGLAFIGLVVVTASASPALATVVSPDGSFNEFRFDRAVSAVVGCGSCTPTTNPVANTSNSPPWTFGGAASIFITDLGVRGDRFEVFDNAVSLGVTSVPINDGGGTCAFNIGDCSVALGYSRGTFAVGPGAHSLTINLTQNAAGTTFGNAAFSVSAAAAVPEPGTLLLWSSGAAALALRFWRRRAV
jgi:PEP-CTERM motif-containing protein